MSSGRQPAPSPHLLLLLLPDCPPVRPLLQIAISTISGGVSSQSLQISSSSGSGGDDDLPYRPEFFYLLFMLASCYVASADCLHTLDLYPCTAWA